ncbi:thermonuclease family protein [Microbacterium sp. 179-B 1A2 NHS]|uniref:thermonuclease family protein n=1 Tax=Microbacterium sp. 179-B 1A2 NHS TaxID=3142383 RepID=UPI0039A06021
MTLRRFLLGAAAVLVAAGIWMLLASDLAPPSATTPAAAELPADATPFTVTHVFDGDTLEARRGDAEPVRIRLIGIDTPEGTPAPECGADAARDRLRELLPEGSTVWAATDREETDRYGRLLRYAWNADEVFVNGTLVREGHASALRVEPNTTHAAAFAESESLARRDGAGQWGACG